MRYPRARLFRLGLAALVLLVGGCGDDDAAQVDAVVQPDAAVQPDADVTDPFAVTERVEVVTSMGTFVLSLYGNGAPNTVTNFLHYVDAGQYTATQSVGSYDDVPVTPVVILSMTSIGPP